MDILFPIKWVIELLLTTFHNVLAPLLGADSGITWVLAIVGVVICVRAALIPVFVRQIKSQRGMMQMQPELQKLQKKYKGKTDRASREAFAKEQMELYKRTGSSPFSSCLPLLIQMPIFFSLFTVLSEASKKGTDGKFHDSAVGFVTAKLAESFHNATFLGAPLKATLLQNEGIAAVIWLGVTMIILMTASQFITQKQIMAKNQNQATMTSQYMRTQNVMLYLFPVIFLVSGLAFPLALMFYWLTSNFWTMAQQFIVIRNMPTPGSIAHEQRQVRLERKGKLNKLDTKVETTAEAEDEAPKSNQRNQPVNKNRAKKRK